MSKYFTSSKKFYTLFFLLIFSYVRLSAQETSPGFIVTMGKDTVKGFIQEGTDAELRSEITFVKSGTTEKVTYSPADLHSFGFDYGRTFESFRFPYTGNEGEMIFAKKALYGKITLFTAPQKTQRHPDIVLVNNATKETFYLQEPEKIKVETEKGGTAISESLRHMGILNLAKGGPQPDTRPFKYNEKRIKSDIHKYNKQFRSDFSSSIYRPHEKVRYDITAGFEIVSSKNYDEAFRFSAYRLKYFPERSTNLSYIMGFSYRFLQRHSYLSNGSVERILEFRRQAFSIVPAGINIQGSSKKLKPFFYLGPSLAIYWDTRDRFVNNVNVGYKHDFLIFPALNVGAGLKIKAGSNYIITEVTPSPDTRGLFVNLGYSF